MKLLTMKFIIYVEVDDSNNGVCLLDLDFDEEYISWNFQIYSVSTTLFLFPINVFDRENKMKDFIRNSKIC